MSVSSIAGSSVAVLDASSAVNQLRTQSTASDLSRFRQLRSFGVITAQADYSHADQVHKFLCKHSPKPVWRCSQGLNDQNYSTPTRVIQPGESFHVDLIVPERARPASCLYSYTSEDALEFLAATGGVFTGAQGLTLLLEGLIEHHKLHLLPLHYSILNFDESEKLWNMQEGGAQVPGIQRRNMSSDYIALNLSPFEQGWGADVAFLRMTPMEGLLQPPSLIVDEN